MGGKHNQTIAIARFLAYKCDLNRQFEGVSDEDYMKNPMGFEVGQYMDDLMKYCSESTVDTVLRHQEHLILRLGEEYLSIIAFLNYDGGGRNV